MPYKIVFFGTSEFSIPSLKALLDDKRFEVTAVITKPDSPTGRHQVVTPPPIKILAQKHNVQVFQFEKIKTDETFAVLSTLSSQGVNPTSDESTNPDCRTPSDFARNDNIDAYVVVSYGKILPQRILNIPKRGVINVHGSLLPRWRGASCVQAAIAAGDEKAGITIMQMDAEMDHGAILAQKEINITPTETGGELHDRLAELGAMALPDVLVEFLENKITSKTQNHEQATYCKLLSRDDGKIDWSKSATEIERLVRAYNPWPGTWTERDGKRVKIVKVTTDNLQELKADVGALQIADDKLIVRCGDNKSVEILELQPEGKRVMTAQEYIAGHR